MSKSSWVDIINVLEPHFDITPDICSVRPTGFNLSPTPLLEKAMAPDSSTLAWKIPWMEEPGGLQSMGSLRVGHDWVTSLSLFTFMHWRRKWQPTPVFFPGESQEQGEPGGLLCLGSHRVGHDWSDLAAAAATPLLVPFSRSPTVLSRYFNTTLFPESLFTGSLFTIVFHAWDEKKLIFLPRERVGKRVVFLGICS